MANLKLNFSAEIKVNKFWDYIKPPFFNENYKWLTSYMI